MTTKVANLDRKHGTDVPEFRDALEEFTASSGYKYYPGLFTNPLAVDFSACDASLVAGSFAAGESRVLPQLCDSHLRHERREEAAVEASGTATGDPAVA